MSRSIAARFLACAALALVAGCGSYRQNDTSVGNAPGAAYASVQYGYVDRIEVVSVASRTSGGGAVLGAVIGGVIGHQIGSGTGRDVATGVGAVGGAVIGNRIERRNRAEDEVYRVTVRFDNGQVQQFDYQQINDLQAGDHVKLEGGQLSRL